MPGLTTTERRERARKALGKPAPFGSDISLGTYVERAEEHPYQEDPSKLPSVDKEDMLRVGMTLEDLRGRSGTFIQKDQSVIHYSSSQEGLEVLSIPEAFQTYGWLEELWWKAVDVDADKFTAETEIAESNGYFIRSLAGQKAAFPVQACLYLGHRNLAQRVHNIIIAEEDSELHIISGCTARPMARGLHIGVSEFYVRPGAKISFTMIHNWAPEIEVRPRSAAVIEEDGVFLSNYVCMNPVSSLQMYPTARCVGPNSIVRFSSVVVAPPGSVMDVGSRAILDGEGARAEIISRAISMGGHIIARGDIRGNAPNVKGHLECRGLILADEGTIHAIPELVGTLPLVNLSHEAAVGKIAEEELEYLMARGLSRSEATAMIVRGFLNVDIVGLPPHLEAELRRAIEASQKELF